MSLDNIMMAGSDVGAASRLNELNRIVWKLSKFDKHLNGNRLVISHK